MVAIAQAVTHWGVGAAKATANTVTEGIAKATPVAAWEGSLVEVVEVHGVGEEGVG